MERWAAQAVLFCNSFKTEQNVLALRKFSSCSQYKKYAKIRAERFGRDEIVKA